VLGGAWLLIAVVLLAGAVVLRQVPLLLVALLFFLASGIARVWARYALERVEYSRRLSAGRVFWGETVKLEITVANRKLLPLPWVRVDDEVPDELTFLDKLPPSYNPSRLVLTNVLSLGWYHQITRRFSVRCLKRGFHTFGPATIRSGDLFGFFQSEAASEKLDHLLVYPRIVPLEDLGIPSRDPFGDLRLRRHLFEDPVRVMSTRDYAYGDPLKRIHWKATARMGRLQSRVFEATTTVDMALFLDARTVEPPFWGIQEQLLETAIIAAASVSDYGAREGHRVGLYVNETYRHTDRLIKLPPSDDPAQLQRVLEALAHIRGLPFYSLEDVLNSEGRDISWGSTLAVITAVPTEALLVSLVRFRRAGRHVALLLVGAEAPQVALDGLPVYHISDQVYWRELASVRMEEAASRVPQDVPVTGGRRHAR